MIVCLYCHEPVTSGLVLFTGVVEWKIMATVVKILKKQPESDWIYHVTLSRRILFLQKLNFHMYMLLLMNDLKMFPMTFNINLKKKCVMKTYYIIKLDLDGSFLYWRYTKTQVFIFLMHYFLLFFWRIMHGVMNSGYFWNHKTTPFHLFIYLGFYVAFNTVQVISRQVVGRAEETNTYSWSRFCTVNCRPMASNFQLSTWSRAGNRTPTLEVGGESVTTYTFSNSYSEMNTLVFFMQLSILKLAFLWVC